MSTKIKFMTKTIKKKENKIVKKTGEKTGTVKSKLSKKTEKMDSKKNSKMQKDIEGIKDLDPEFYNFLKKNDKKLMEFNLLDSDDDEENNDNDGGSNDDVVEASDDEDEETEKYHKPNSKLEVASDESDFVESDAEDGDANGEGAQKVTLGFLRKLEADLCKPNVTAGTIRKAIDIFNSALASIIVGHDDIQSTGVYKVVGGPVFNGVMQLCVLHLQNAVFKYLCINSHTQQPIYKAQKWPKLRSCLRHYFTDLIRLIESVSSDNIMSVLLKHLHQMSGVVAAFTTLAKSILKRLISIWSTAEDSVRVLAFLCIIKITRSQQKTMLEHVMKAMYLSYVRNSKFVSPNTLPSINFMRRSLVEVFALDLKVSYQHAFLYIRQLAIHLRNAVVLKKKDSVNAVYNWQFINSLRLWGDLLGLTAGKPQLQELIMPLVTVIDGVIRLVPTAQYFPLRFHCVKILINLTKATDVYIPVLPLITEVLRSNTFLSKHKQVSMRPLDFTCILRLNKSQLEQNGFRDEVVEQVFGLTLEYLAHYASSIAFSELVVTTLFPLKTYLKVCSNANHARKIKQLVEKIQDNSKFINQEKLSFNGCLFKLDEVNDWEQRTADKGAPIAIYYESWFKTQETKKRRQASKSDKINADYGLPTINKLSKTPKVTDGNGEVELFPSDSEDKFPIDGLMDSDEEEEPKAKKPKSKEKKRKQKPAVKAPADDADEHVENEPDDAGAAIDIVKDLDIDDW